MPPFCRVRTDCNGRRVCGKMRHFFRQRWRRSSDTGVEERLGEVSADLPYELQSKMFDQLTTLGLAGAGLTVTLIGSLLRDAPVIVWLPVFLFGLAAIFAVSGNNNLIEGLFRHRATIRRSKIYVGLATGLIGIAVGMLSMSVYIEGKSDNPSDTARTSKTRPKTS